MEVESLFRPENTLITGQEIIDIPAGKTLKIETSPQGEDILNITVPEGKKWVATINISIVETDA